MTKAIWMSDLHFTHEGDVLDHDPRVRLAAAVAHINDQHPDADFCVISGDLVNRGTGADYKALRGFLDRIKVPVLPMVGNHDDRAVLRSRLPLPDTCMTDFVQYAVHAPDAIFLCLDTQKTGADAGAFCDVRRAWLRKALAQAGETPVYVFMHHHPMPLGLPMQDQDMLEDGDGFLDILAGSGCVKHLFIGHVHRPITGVVRGIPFATMRSVLYQAPAPVPAWDWGSFAPSREAPQMGVLSVNSGDVTLQYEQFCDFSVGTG